MSGGVRGQEGARGSHGTVAGPCPSRRAVPECPARRFERPDGSIGGTRHAKTVCRGALNARRAAQGRVGDHSLPGTSPVISSHICFFRRTRPLPRTRSVHAFPAAPGPGVAKVSTVRDAASRPKAQPADRSSPRPGARDTELVQPGRDVTPTSARGQSRGKGVLAA